MAIDKEHLEFHTLDMASGWETPPGYPSGIKDFETQIIYFFTVNYTVEANYHAGS